MSFTVTSEHLIQSLRQVIKYLDPLKTLQQGDIFCIVVWKQFDYLSKKSLMCAQNVKLCQCQGSNFPSHCEMNF